MRLFKGAAFSQNYTRLKPKVPTHMKLRASMQMMCMGVGVCVEKDNKKKVTKAGFDAQRVAVANGSTIPAQDLILKLQQYASLA